MIKGIIFICLATLGAGYYLQYVEHLNPCLLCVAQRGAFYGIILFALLTFLPLGRIGRKIMQCGMLLSAACGIFFAGRQLYLEYLPVDQRPACTIPFETLLEMHEWGAAIIQLFQGTSDCGTRQWAFLNMSLPFWSGCIFVVLIIMALISMKRA